MVLVEFNTASGLLWENNFQFIPNRTLEAETPLFDRIISIKQLFPHKALIVPSTTNSMPVRVYHMNIDKSHPESLTNILGEK